MSDNKSYKSAKTSSKKSQLSLDNVIDNQERYKDVMEAINIIEKCEKICFLNNPEEIEDKSQKIKARINSKSSSLNVGGTYDEESQKYSNIIDETEKVSITKENNSANLNTGNKIVDDKYDRKTKSYEDEKDDENNQVKNLKDRLQNNKTDESKTIKFFIDKLEMGKYTFHDKIFEETVTNLLKLKYNLKTFRAFPLINIAKSKETVNYFPQINYFKIIIKTIYDESKEYLFFYDRQFFPIRYNNGDLEFFLLLEKDSEGNLNKLSLFLQNFNYVIYRKMIKSGQKLYYPLIKQLNECNYLEQKKEL